MDLGQDDLWSFLVQLVEPLGQIACVCDGSNARALQYVGHKGSKQEMVDRAWALVDVAKLIKKAQSVCANFGFRAEPSEPFGDLNIFIIEIGANGAPFTAMVPHGLGLFSRKSRDYPAYIFATIRVAEDGFFLCTEIGLSTSPSYRTIPHAFYKKFSSELMPWHAAGPWFKEQRNLLDVAKVQNG